jgi:hypothetical protein
MAVQFFRMSSDDKISYSYRIIWEQIKNAKGLSQKYAIIKSKILRREEKGGMIFRLFKLTVRFVSMIIKNIEIGLRRMIGRY